MGMRINERLYQKIINMQNDLPPETGGILGGIGGCVTTSVYDCGKKSADMCSYTPDVDMLNEIISEWQVRGIEFMGIFHSHFFGVKTLSDGDRSYIECIMRNMPASVSRLYFPIIVMPEKVMVGYKAQFFGKKLVIVKNEVIRR